MKWRNIVIHMVLSSLVLREHWQCGYHPSLNISYVPVEPGMFVMIYIDGQFPEKTDAVEIIL